MQNGEKTIAVVLGSVREGRVVERVAVWVQQEAKQLPGLKLKMLDLKEINLPFYNEPKSPDTLNGVYSHPVAQQWHDAIQQVDGVVWLTPEYNHSYSAVIKNAIDYLSEPLKGKPYAIISYSPGAIGGARAAMQLRSLLDYMGGQFRAEYNLNFVTKLVDTEGRVTDSAAHERLQSLFSKLIIN